MTKKSSRVKFALVSIILAIGIALSIFSFTIPFTNTIFNGFANSIPLGTDVAGGYSSVYDIEAEAGDLDEKMDFSVSFIGEVLKSQGYNDAVVSKQGKNQIKLQTSKNNEPKTLIKTLGDASNIYIRSEQTGDHTSNELVGKDIKNVYARKQQTSETTFSWGVIIEFTTQAGIGEQTGAEKYEALTNTAASGDQRIFIYLDDELFTPINGISEAQTNGMLFLSGGNITSRESANQFALQVLVGTLETKLTLAPNAITEIPATLGNNFLLFALIGFGILTVISLIALIIKFKDFGWLSILSYAIFGVLLVFFMQAVPLVTLNFGAIIAIALGLAILFFSHYFLFSNIGKEYAYGKKLPLSVKSGYKKSVLPIVDFSACAIIASFVLWLLGDVFTKSFGVVLVIALAINLFTTLLATKAFMKWYLSFNSTKGKKLGFKRGEKVNEI